jgi:hypothetical protein
MVERCVNAVSIDVEAESPEDLSRVVAHSPTLL